MVIKMTLIYFISENNPEFNLDPFITHLKKVIHLLHVRVSKKKSAS